jgi:nucleotide-binding universal stress UspA family protein
MTSLRRILLATDLGARSDRAMDRAALLAREHDAELLVLHVLEPIQELWPAPQPSYWTYGLRGNAQSARDNPKLVELARRQLGVQLSGFGNRMDVRIEDGDPAEAILRVARESVADLLVTGVARNEFLGRFTLGKTVDRVARETEISMLIVNDRALAPYRKVLVAVDFSPASREALQCALALFPGLRCTVFHGYDIPYASFTNARDESGEVRMAAHARTAAFVQEAVPSREDVDRIDVIVERGDPATVLRRMGGEGSLELVVLGTNPRGAVVRALLGSVAERIVATLPCDALVVRPRP